MPDEPEPTQLDKFKEAARELETDDDPERFKERLGKIVKPRRADPNAGGDEKAP